MVMKRHSYKKNYNIKNKRKSKINGGRPPIEDNDQCRVIATLSQLYPPMGYVFSVAFHPKLHLLATGSSDNTAKLWRFLADGSMATCVATLRGHGNSVNSVAFHPELPLLATGSNEMTAKLWSFNPLGSEATNMSVTCVATLEGEHFHRSYVNSVAFHPTLPLLATGSWDETAKLWRFNPHGSASDNMSATCVATMEGRHGHTRAVTSVAFHSKLPLLATGSHDRTAKLWSFDPDGSADDNMLATCVAILEGEHGHKYGVLSVAFHPMLPLLATSSMDNTAKLWSFDPHGLARGNMSETCITTLEGEQGHKRGVSVVAFHPSLPLLATGSWDQTAKLWRFNTHGAEKDNMSATCVATLTGHRNDVKSVAFHPALPLLATGSIDNTAKFWRCKMLISPYNDFTLYRKKGDVSENICNSLCYLCNFNLCKKNQSDNNNSNGYVVKLTTGDLTKDIHVHYNCLHFQLTTNKTEIDNIPISSDTIQTILNIDDKMNALIGTDFYK
jgi:WD40 repeat protein